MLSPRKDPKFELAVSVSEAQRISKSSADRAKEIFTNLATRIASMDDKAAIAEVRKAQAELKAIHSELNEKVSMLFRGLPASLAARQDMHDIAYQQKLIEQRLTALFWITKGDSLVARLERGEGLGEVILRQWNFVRVQNSDEAILNPLHHTRIPFKEGGETINKLLSRVSGRVTEAVEDVVMLKEVTKLAEDEKKRQQVEKETHEAKQQSEIDRKKGVLEDGKALGNIKNSITEITIVLDKFPGKKGGIFKRALSSCVSSEVDQIREICTEAKTLVERGKVREALAKLDDAAKLLSQPSKGFFGKKEPPYKSEALSALDKLKDALPDRYKSQLATLTKSHLAETARPSLIRRLSGRGGGA